MKSLAGSMLTFRKWSSLYKVPIPYENAAKRPLISPSLSALQTENSSCLKRIPLFGLDWGQPDAQPWPLLGRAEAWPPSRLTSGTAQGGGSRWGLVSGYHLGWQLLTQGADSVHVKQAPAHSLLYRRHRGGPEWEAEKGGSDVQRPKEGASPAVPRAARCTGTMVGGGAWRPGRTVR